MIALIDVKNSSNQNINITSKQKQVISVTNETDQEIEITIPPTQEVDVVSNPDQHIEVLPLWPSMSDVRELEIAINSKVPKVLNILPQVESGKLSTIEARTNSQIYIQVGDVPSFATLEQLKELNTKTIYVDKLTDSKIYNLSYDDIVMLRKE